MADIRDEVQDLKERQREVFDKLQANMSLILRDCMETAELTAGLGLEGFEFNEQVRQQIEWLRDYCKPKQKTPKANSGKRATSEEKMKFLEAWLSEQDQPFTHKILCKAFAPLNNGKTVQRTYYMDQLQQLIEAGLVHEENVGEGHERPRLLFTRVDPIEQEITNT